MPKGFEHLTYAPEARRAAWMRSEKSVPPSASAGVRQVPLFESDEAAARYHLAQLAAKETKRAFQTLAIGNGPPPISSDPLPNLALVKSSEPLNVTATRLVRFQQLHSGVPVFGSGAIVELDSKRNLVSASMEVADLHDVAPTPTVSADQAREKLVEISRLGDDEVRQLEATLKYFHHPTQGAWHLAWTFEGVPATPKHQTDGPPLNHPQVFGKHSLPADYDYFIDAHTGDLLYYFSNVADVAIPTWCRGQDEEGQTRTFFGRRNGVGFEMDNPFEQVRTYDLALQKIEQVDPPSSPIQNSSADWQNSNPAAVSAQINSTRVLDFLFRVLRRKSIDDQGMPLLNIVNCSSEDAQHHPEWKNAVWYRGRMWYGQESLGNGRYRSLARHLDIIAHELTHGVTENTARLVYRDLSGALNESISDIFGVIINNWHTPNAADPDLWNWEIGVGLGLNGAAMRNMKNPGSVGRWFKPDGIGGWTEVSGFPAHMSDYITLPVSYDEGGVHIFSNIHNRAAYLVLTAKQFGGYVFTPEEVAVLYYLTLTRLTRLSDFSDARRELSAVAKTIYAGDPGRLSACESAIDNAYDSVGID